MRKLIFDNQNNRIVTEDDKTNVIYTDTFQCRNRVFENVVTIFNKNNDIALVDDYLMNDEDCTQDEREDIIEHLYKFITKQTASTITNPLYWDCECKDNYIHLKSMVKCDICGCHSDDMPDSIEAEVKPSQLIQALKAVKANLEININRRTPLTFDEMEASLSAINRALSLC